MPNRIKLSTPDSYRTAPSSGPAYQTGKLGCLAIFGLLLLTIVLTVAGTVWAIQSQLFARNFKPVELNTQEQQTLEQKLNALGDTESTLLSSLAATTESADANTDATTDGDNSNNVVSGIESNNSGTGNNEELQLRTSTDLKCLATEKRKVGIDID